MDDGTLQNERYPQQLQPLIDALVDHVAILDEHSTILAVNAAWRQFANANGLRSTNYGIGTSYLDVCDMARGEDGEEAPRVAAAIRKLLVDKKGTFHCEYPCHGPTQRRWFRTRGSCFQIGGRLYVILSSENITEQKEAVEALRQRENQYRELIANLNLGVVVYTSDASILLFNEKAAELLGIATDQTLGDAVIDYAGSFVRDDGTVVSATEYPVNRVLRTQQPLRDLVFGIDRPDTEGRRWVSVDALPEFNADQQLERVVVTFLDITERERLQQREQLRLGATFESIGDSIIITDEEGTIQYVNFAFERLTGYSRSEALGRNPRLLQSGQHDDNFYRRMWQHLAEYDIWQGEFVDKHKDGRLYDAEATITRIRDAAGSAIGYVGVQRDVSDRKRAEQALAESAARIRAILETAVDGIITIDERGMIDSCNPAVEKMFGYSMQEMIGQNVSLLMPSPEREEHDGYLARYKQTRERRIIGAGREVRGRRKDGALFPLDLSVSETPLGDRVLYTGIVRDATPRHRSLQAEKGLAASQEQLRVARSIQQAFFPCIAPVVPGFDLDGASYPAEETGGDYFDYFLMPEGCIGIVVADVCGHGLGPALLMSQTRAYLHALLPLGFDVSELATRLNTFLVANTPGERFVTLFLAQLDPRDGSFVYASAGHECLLLGPNDEVQTLGGTSVPLGIVPERVPSARPRTLHSGQIVLFLTDGIQETTSPEGVAFGVERVFDVVRSNWHLPAGEITKRLYQSARSFAQDTPQKDDITAVVLKVGKGADFSEKTKT